MDITITNIFYWTMKFLSDLSSKLDLDYSKTILNIGYEFKNCHLQVCLVKCFFILFCKRKLPLKSMVAMSFPKIVLIVIPGILIGKTLPGLFLFCWWTSVLCFAYYMSEAVALILLIIFAMLFTVYENAVSMFVLACGVSLWKRGTFRIQGDRRSHEALSLILLASTIGILCECTEVMSEYTTVPIFIILMNRIAMLFIPDIANWYLIAANGTYVCNLLATLYCRLTTASTSNSEDIL